MTRATTIAFVPRNPMARILSGLDRKSFADHVAGAEQAMQALSPGLVQSLDSDVGALAQLCRQEEDAVFGQCREIARLALTIVETARFAQRLGLALAAQGIWEMVEALTERGVWHTDALRLHADALGKLMAAEDGPEGLAVTTELARMRETLGAAAKA